MLLRSRGILVLAAVALGCSRHQAHSPSPLEASSVAVQVENQYSASATIYLESGGVARRLGQVNLADTRSFVVPWSRVMTGSLRLRAEVIGSSERVVTEELRIQPGQIVRWTLAARLNLSSVVMY